MDVLYALVGRWIGTWPAQYNANANGKDALTAMIVTEAIVEHLPPDHLYLLAARLVTSP
jgi:hypothetical protein